jgi:HlyD family secretion protein
MANAGQSRLSTILLWLFGIAIIVGIVFAVRSFTREDVEVTVVPVTYQTLSSTVSTNGKIEPIYDFQAHAPFAGAIKRIFVEVGEKVRKGTLLVRMDDADAQARIATSEVNLSGAENMAKFTREGGNREEQYRFQQDLQQAQLDQQHATEDVATKKALQAKGAASGAEVAGAQQHLDAMNINLAAARKRATARYDPVDLQNAKLHVADAEAGVEAAKNALANVDVRSPIDGTVYNIPVNQYDWVQFGEDILDVADLNKLQVRAYFDEPEIGKLAVGQAVRIEWAAKRDHIWHGHVSLAPTTINSYGTRNVGVCLISVDDPTPDLIPNTNVTVTVIENERPHVLSIPREALHTDGPRSYVYRIVDGKLAQTTVEPGVVNLTNAEIKSGLNAGDLIVLGAKSSVTELSDGLPVKQVK